MLPRSRNFLILLALAGMLLALAGGAERGGSVPSAAAQPSGPTCHVGRPSNCVKYGGSRHCERKNTLGDVKATCAAWRSACLECHRVGAVCIGEAGTTRGTPLCKACNDLVPPCLHRIDAQYWPNRLAD
jgi:hypothetical protein